MKCNSGSIDYMATYRILEPTCATCAMDSQPHHFLSVSPSGFVRPRCAPPSEYSTGLCCAPSTCGVHHQPALCTMMHKGDLCTVRPVVGGPPCWQATICSKNHSLKSLLNEALAQPYVGKNLKCSQWCMVRLSDFSVHTD